MKNGSNQSHGLSSPHLMLWQREHSHCLWGSVPSIQDQQWYLAPRVHQDLIFFLRVSYWLLPTNRSDCKPTKESLLGAFLLASPPLPLHGIVTDLGCTAVCEHRHNPPGSPDAFLCLSLKLHIRKQYSQDNFQKQFSIKVVLMSVPPKIMGLHRYLPL